jgi:chromosome segregation ATPase
MNTLVEEMLMDCLDMAKIVYKKGLTGQLVLGDQKTIFEVAPEYYTTTSFDIHLADTVEVTKEQEMIKQFAMQLATANLVDPETLFIMSTSKSLTEMKEAAIKSLREKKAENNQIQQLQQQLEQAQNELQQLQKQLEASTKKIAQLNEKKLNIEQQNNQMDQELGYYKIEKDAELKNRELDIIEQRNKLEAA